MKTMWAWIGKDVLERVSGPMKFRHLRQPAIACIIAIALILEVAYQTMVLHFVYPGEALLAALGLAILPFLIVRGLVNRSWTLRRR